MLAHLAFLKTLPCPTFNCQMRITIHSKVFVINELEYNKIPERNSIAIRTLFQICDVRSILQMWKALLFDYSVILISSQASLQFYIAEALKQLIFPLAWQHVYIQPAGQEMRGLTDAPFPKIICCSPLDFDFNYFTELQESEPTMNMAILDIDSSFTNQINVPTLENEGDTLRVLNTLKNKRIYQSDYAFSCMYKEFDEEEH